LFPQNTQVVQNQSNKAESALIMQAPSKKGIKSFNDVLNHFPIIARQLQPGLERVFKDFNKDIGKPLPATEGMTRSIRSRSSSASSESNMNGSIHSTSSRRHAKRVSLSSSSMFADDEEDHMRKVLESAVNAAIDLFQLVDKQQLSLLGATTDLTGPAVERLIERYITEQVNDLVIFPRLRAIHQKDDHDLEARLHHMTNIDVAQVGIDIEGGKSGKRKVTARLTTAIDEFRKLSVGSGPQQMLETLLETQKILSGNSDRQKNLGSNKLSEKPSPMNADTLVSLLLLVVIRSGVRHLQARLAYMRNFIFIDDVESGELGYALSTFEAVLQYIATDSGGLRIASRRNKRLWLATKRGNLSEMRTILEPENDSISDEPDSIIGDDRSFDDLGFGSQFQTLNGSYHASMDGQSTLNGDAAGPSNSVSSESSDMNLAHVFPFQSARRDQQQIPERPKPIKRVSLDLQSLSGVSEYSFHSRTDTINSRISMIEGDTSIEKLCQTEDSSGNSVLMMAIEAQQPEALDYLLSLEGYYPAQTVFEDMNGKGTTLLSAAIQTGHSEICDILVEYVFSLHDIRPIKEYLTKADEMGRTAAHYLFHTPWLIPKFGTLIPWRLKDKNGQTPLFALCRSYDHPLYVGMVNFALQFAVDEQGDGQDLHIDYHVDNKGNTILHAITDPYLALRILQYCDADPNSANVKLFTPLMMASKFGRFELVRTFFLDPRVDTLAKEYRGMTAVELAKDDDVRNRIDDLTLVSNAPMPDGRVTAIVRSFFVEDGSIRLIIKTATKNSDGLVAVTTCRRSLNDFEHLTKWLAVEHPASWLPSIFNFRSPFQVPSKPSRAVLHDIQVRLNKFLRVMLAHSTFGSHELLWEFILMPEIQPDMMAERSLKKAEIRQEKVREEYSPIEDVRDVESFIIHARESVRGVNHATKSVLRRVTAIRNATRGMTLCYVLIIFLIT
jgi:ankyrin repeat protein